MQTWEVEVKRVGSAAAAALLAVGPALTAASSVPASTAGYVSVSLTGATAKRLDYTVAAGTITGVRVIFDGTLGLKTVMARFGMSSPGVCVVGAYDVAANQTPADCTGFSQSASRSWSLVISVA